PFVDGAWITQREQGVKILQGQSKLHAREIFLKVANHVFGTVVRLHRSNVARPILAINFAALENERQRLPFLIDLIMVDLKLAVLSYRSKGRKRCLLPDHA